MGNTFGSLHVRRPAWAQLREVLAAEHAERGTRFLVLRVPDGWTAIYPFHAGQDPEVSRRIAAAGGWTVFHLLVHDDDLLQYHLFAGPALLDRFDSNPDYFGEVTADQRRTWAGDPAVLAREFDDPFPDEIRRILDDASAPLPTALHELRDGFPPARAARALAKRLKLARIDSAYEDLAESPSASRGMERIPDERAAARQAKASVREGRRSLEREKLLVDSLNRKERDLGFAPTPLVAPHHERGFVLAWSRMQPSPTAFFHWRGPGDVVPLLADVGIEARPHRLALSPDGRFAAVGSAGGTWRVDLYDLERAALVAQLEMKRSCNALVFSGDSKQCLARSEDELVLIDTATGVRVDRRMVGHGNGLAIGPGGVIVLGLTHNKVGLVEPSGTLRHLATGREDNETWKTLRASGVLPATVVRRGEVTSITMDDTAGDIIVTVHEGIRVYAWREVMEASDELPPPRLSANTLPIPGENESSYTYASVLDEVARRCLAGTRATVNWLDLTTGRSGVLLEPPGQPPVWSLALSVDRAHLATVSQRELHSRGRRPPADLDIWDYRALLARASAQ